MNIQKKITITFHLTLEINDSHLTSAETPGHPEFKARQIRFLQALLANKDMLQQYIDICMASHFIVEMPNESDVYKLLTGKDFEDENYQMFLPVIQQLSKEDQEVFKGAEEEGYFYESTEGASESFSITTDDVTYVVEDEA